jgi:hypothetical protein
MSDSLRAQLQAIYDRRGGLTPAMVVDEARDPSNPLHGRFEWDDEVAGEKFREGQAHQLIRSVRVRFISNTMPGESFTVRAFHAIREPSGYVYRPAEVVAQDEFASRLLLADMQREWKQLLRRYQEFAGFWKMVNETLSEHDLDDVDQPSLEDFAA